MKITINILKRHLYVTAFLFAVFLALTFAIAGNYASETTKVGHDINEIDWSQNIPRSIVIAGDINTQGKIEATGRVKANGYDMQDNSLHMVTGGFVISLPDAEGKKCAVINMDKTTCFTRGSYCTLAVLTDYDGNDDVRVLYTQVAGFDGKPASVDPNILYLRHTSGGEAHLRWAGNQEFEFGWNRAFVKNFNCDSDQRLPWGTLAFRVADGHSAKIYWEGPGRSY